MKTQKRLIPLAMALVALLSVGAQAGDDNPQANAVTIAGSTFVYGSVSTQALIDACQSRRNKAVSNYSMPNNVLLTNLAESESANLGINIAAGNSHQPKNYVVAASSAAVYIAAAKVAIDQDSQHNAIASDTSRCDRQWL